MTSFIPLEARAAVINAFDQDPDLDDEHPVVQPLCFLTDSAARCACSVGRVMSHRFRVDGLSADYAVGSSTG
jgi:hypothetical protein